VVLHVSIFDLLKFPKSAYIGVDLIVNRFTRDAAGGLTSNSGSLQESHSGLLPLVSSPLNEPLPPHCRPITRMDSSKAWYNAGLCIRTMLFCILGLYCHFKVNYIGAVFLAI